MGHQAQTDADSGGTRLLLRLDGWVHNAGAGALEIRGSGPSNGTMTTVRQYVGGAPVTHDPEPTMVYETNDEHNHWHLFHAMKYSLWSADRSVEVAPAQKVGFCLEDTEPVEAGPTATPVYTEHANDFCASGNTTVPSLTEGISAGWRDWYAYQLAFQWVDVSDVTPGTYWLRADSDPDNVIAESDENNVGTYAADPSTVNGWRADPVAVGTVGSLTPSTITLKATKFDDGSLRHVGPLQYQVVTPPAGGTLGQPTGTWFDATTLQYTPRPGFSGSDTFTVAARDASSPFPLHPAGAAVTLSVQAPAPQVLGISGAPVVVYANSQTQLSASGPGVEQGVTWTASAGTVWPTGLFRAPATVPAGGKVVISATSASGATGSVTIGIDTLPVVRPAPTLKPPRPPRHGLSRIKLQAHARTVIAVVSSARRGRVRFTGYLKGARFGHCSGPVARRGSITCRMQVPASSVDPRASLLCRISRTLEVALPPVTVKARLFRHGRVVARRQAFLR